MSLTIHHEGASYTVADAAGFVALSKSTASTMTGIPMPPKVALQISDELWQAAKRLIAAQDAAQGAQS